jgi:hypothetical protein
VVVQEASALLDQCRDKLQQGERPR